MSGKKQYEVDMSAWVRRQMTKFATRVVNAADPAAVAELRRQTSSEIGGELRALSQRQADVDGAVARLSEQTRDLEADTARRLREHAEDLDRRLRASSGELRSELLAALGASEQHLRAEIAQERLRREDAMAAMQRQLTDLARDRYRARAAARQWLADAAVMRDLVRDTLPHERYAPGELAALERRLATAGRDLEQGHAESALGVAQETFHGLSDLRLDLELRHREWMTAQATAREALHRVEAELDRRDLPMRDPEGQELAGVTFDLGYWSKGELAALRDEVARASAAVRDGDRPMSTEALRDVAERAAPEFEQRWQEVVDRAQLRLLASQLRVNVADEVVTTLHEVAGYGLEDHTYARSDEREAFYAKLMHPNGNEIVVVVAPDPGHEERSTMRLLSYDQDTTSEEQRRARGAELAAQLRDKGMSISDPAVEPGAPSQRERDFAEIRGEREQVQAPGPAGGAREAPGARPLG